GGDGATTSGRWSIILPVGGTGGVVGRTTFPGRCPNGCAAATPGRADISSAMRSSRFTIANYAVERESLVDHRPAGIRSPRSMAKLELPSLPAELETCLELLP